MIPGESGKCMTRRTKNTIDSNPPSSYRYLKEMSLPIQKLMIEYMPNDVEISNANMFYFAFAVEDIVTSVIDVAGGTVTNKIFHAMHAGLPPVPNRIEATDVMDALNDEYIVDTYGIFHG